MTSCRSPKALPPTMRNLGFKNTTHLQENGATLRHRATSTSDEAKRVTIASLKAAPLDEGISSSITGRSLRTLITLENPDDPRILKTIAVSNVFLRTRIQILEKENVIFSVTHKMVGHWIKQHEAHRSLVFAKTLAGVASPVELPSSATSKNREAPNDFDNYMESLVQHFNPGKNLIILWSRLPEPGAAILANLGNGRWFTDTLKSKTLSEAASSIARLLDKKSLDVMGEPFQKFPVVWNEGCEADFDISCPHEAMEYISTWASEDGVDFHTPNSLSYIVAARKPNNVNKPNFTNFTFTTGIGSRSPRDGGSPRSGGSSKTGSPRSSENKKELLFSLKPFEDQRKQLGFGVGIHVHLQTHVSTNKKFSEKATPHGLYIIPLPKQELSDSKTSVSHSVLRLYYKQCLFWLEKIFTAHSQRIS